MHGRSSKDRSLRALARLQQHAGPGEVLVNQVTRELIGSAFVGDKLDLLELKGFSHPVPAWRVSSLAPAGAIRPIEGRSLTRLVGREHELALLLDRWEQAKGGEGQVLLLSGEPGMGKSRLLKELADRLEPPSCTTLRYQCSPYHVDNALHPVIQHFVRAAHITPSDDDTARVAKLEALLVASRLDVASAVPLLTGPR
jgi:hypothetical protein